MTPRLTVDVTIAADDWRRMLPDAEAAVRGAAEAAWRSLDPAGPAEVSVLLTDDETVRQLNARHRGIDRPTNVLSFALGETAPGPGQPSMLGDVVLAAGVVAREAAAQGKPAARHISHLVVHGMLHLLGYDHETDSQAETMEALELRVLAGLGFPNPYLNHEAAE